MCEKPISVDIITTEQVLAKAASKPNQKLLIPFCRRCECHLPLFLDISVGLVTDDDSYTSAKQLVENGSLGEIHAVETTCLDQQDPTGKSIFQLPPFNTVWLIDS